MLHLIHTLSMVMMECYKIIMLISFSNYKYINALTVFSSLIVSVSIIYILGLLWLGYLIGWDKPIFKLGAQPFLLAELFKLFLLTALYPWIIKLNKII